MGLSDRLERVTEEGPHETTNEDSNLLRHGDAPARLSLTDEDRLNGWRDGVTSTGRRYFYHSSDLSNAVWAGEESHAAKEARLKAAEEAEDRAREEKALGIKQMQQIIRWRQVRILCVRFEEPSCVYGAHHARRLWTFRLPWRCVCHLSADASGWPDTDSCTD